MATKAQVINRAANDLGILRLGQTLRPADNQRLKEAYDEVYAQLKKDGLATWTSTGDVPAEAVPYVVVMVAENCLNIYGVSTERHQRIKNDHALAPSKLRELIVISNVSSDEPTDY